MMLVETSLLTFSKGTSASAMVPTSADRHVVNDTRRPLQQAFVAQVDTSASTFVFDFDARVDEYGANA
jgi:hypothetical protein